MFALELLITYCGQQACSDDASLHSSIRGSKSSSQSPPTDNNPPPSITVCKYGVTQSKQDTKMCPVFTTQNVSCFKLGVCPETLDPKTCQLDVT